ncbi:hypothetical protein [Sediminibacterium sp.]|uniref:hypothetical protein n=1 Tax=Sediminibacterium sp. TaxID=1917865 RepID=UPI00272F9DD4|nr:hypothetical protein [Sediminibacterium sp.]MDP1971621.1 hypothetical protein [Sediminibacterium sp.]MDP2420597.1 hypothetical protein [Sediminibacterium sp.]
MNKYACFFVIVFITFSSCSTLTKTAKKDFNDGYYYQRIDGKKQFVFIDNEDDIIRIHATKIDQNISIIDTIGIEYQKATSFNQASFDIDFLTIPLKFRPTQLNVPPQLNTNLNGAVYFGYRNDKYVISYDANPLGKSFRNINHFGFSIGAFTGFGNTFMSPTNTNNILQQEYDGIVWSKGVAGILAVNNFTLGLAIGFDNLLDKNQSIWIYKNKPWLGLAFGLNLN